MYDLTNNNHLRKATRENYYLREGKVKNENRADNSES